MKAPINMNAHLQTMLPTLSPINVSTIPSQQTQQNNNNNFFFRRRHGKIDWRLLARVDLEHLVRTVDIDMLQSYVEHVTFADLVEDDLVAISLSAIIVLFRLCQLIIEYLLNVQNYLLSALQNSNKEVERLNGHCEQLNAKLLEYEKEQTEWKAEKKRWKLEKSEWKKEKKYLKELMRLSCQQNSTIVSSLTARATANKPTPSLEDGRIFACKFCTSAFISSEYLQSHVQRRHPNNNIKIDEEQEKARAEQLERERKEKELLEREKQLLAAEKAAALERKRKEDVEEERRKALRTEEEQKLREEERKRREEEDHRYEEERRLKRLAEEEQDRKREMDRKAALERERQSDAEREERERQREAELRKKKEEEKRITGEKLWQQIVEDSEEEEETEEESELDEEPATPVVVEAPTIKEHFVRTSSLPPLPSHYPLTTAEFERSLATFQDLLADFSAAPENDQNDYVADFELKVNDNKYRQEAKENVVKDLAQYTLSHLRENAAVKSVTATRQRSISPSSTQTPRSLTNSPSPSNLLNTSEISPVSKFSATSSILPSQSTRIQSSPSQPGALLSSTFTFTPSKSIQPIRQLSFNDIVDDLETDDEL